MQMARVQPTDWHFYSARPCTAPVIINITFKLHWVIKYIRFQVSLKCTNFDINTNICINFIPNNDSFVPKKNFFPVQFDNLEHAVGLIGVYHTGE